jgi:hypothetical protein
MRASAFLIAIALILPPGTAAAQEAGRELSAIDSRVRQGDELIVTDTDGHRLRGQFEMLSATALVLTVSGAPMVMDAARVRTVTRTFRDRRWPSALIGFGVGAGIGAGLGRSLMREYDRDVSAGDAVAIALQLGVAGAGVGFLVDAIVPGRQTIYRRMPVVTLVPVGSRGSAFVVTMAF